ncbi:MAG: cysteine synthase A [Spirochaetes bacterium]|nr:cysteine synthase A [Spirochaetota bacterium]
MRKRIARDSTELVGKTPLVYLDRFADNSYGRIAAKIEYFNPGGSLKDRIALNMIRDAEKRGFLKEGATIIEPTSGNTGIGLAFICAVRGYRLILTMPDTMSHERRKILKAYGAELVITPGESGMKASIEKAEELIEEYPDAFMPQQFNNPSNPEAHEKTTGVEIWEDSAGDVDIFIAGVGTGGTITGVSKFLKKKKDSIKFIAVEPSNSPVLSGGKAGKHSIQGIGAGFIPSILNMNCIDEIITVSDKDAFETSKQLARQEGIFAGVSSGAAAWAALQVAGRKENEGKLIVVVFPDNAEKYLSTGLLE